MTWVCNHHTGIGAVDGSHAASPGRRAFRWAGSLPGMPYTHLHAIQEVTAQNRGLGFSGVSVILKHNQSKKGHINPQVFFTEGSFLQHTYSAAEFFLVVLLYPPGLQSQNLQNDISSVCLRGKVDWTALLFVYISGICAHQ